MADYGVAVTWGDMKSGREKQALEAWAEGAALNDKAVANGQIERWDAVIFEPVGSPPSGAIRIYGTQDQVEEFIRSDDFRSTVQQAAMSLNAVGYRRFMTGDALLEGFARASEAINAL